MKNIRLLIIILALIKILIPYVLQNAVYQPYKDEFLYLDQAAHLDWGYYENPPLISLFAWITKIWGNNFVWIKFWPSIFGALTFYVTAEMALAFGGRSFSVFLVFMAFTVTSLLRIHFILAPTCFELFFTTAMALTLLRYVQTEKSYWLYLFAVSAGLGILSKYTVGIYMIALLVGLLLSLKAKIFINYHFYLALILAAIIVSPNYLWQQQHGFPVAHLLQDMKGTGYKSDSSFGDFLNNQFMLLLPCFYLWVMGVLYIILTNKGRVNYVFLLTAFLLTIIFLFSINAKESYALNAYPALIALGAYNFDRITRKYMKFLRYGMITFSALFGLYVAGLAVPFLPQQPLSDLYSSKQFLTTGILKWDDQQNHALPQDFADMLGWKEVSDRTLRIFSTFTDDSKSHTLVLTDDYAIAGSLNYFGPSQGLPFAYCNKGSYMYWLPETQDVNTIILLTRESINANDDVFKHFKQGTQMDDITIPFSRISSLKIMLYSVPDGQQNDALKQFVISGKQALNRKQFN